MKEGQAILEEKKEEMSKLEAEEAQLQKKQIDVKHDVEKYENLVKDNQAKSKHWKKEVCVMVTKTSFTLVKNHCKAKKLITVYVSSTLLHQNS